jgi:hypothetical protein
MTVNLNLRPEVESDLVARARASGMSVEQYVLLLVERSAGPAARNEADTGQTARVEAVRRMVEFGEKHRLSLGEPITRKLLYEGHRFLGLG